MHLWISTICWWIMILYPDIHLNIFFAAGWLGNENYFRCGGLMIVGREKAHVRVSVITLLLIFNGATWGTPKHLWFTPFLPSMFWKKFQQVRVRWFLTWPSLSPSPLVQIFSDFECVYTPPNRKNCHFRLRPPPSCQDVQTTENRESQRCQWHLLVMKVEKRHISDDIVSLGP